MAAKQITRNIALTPHFDMFVQSRVESGRYQSASEVVRDGLRLLEEREELRLQSIDRMTQMIEAGWQQSEAGEVMDGAQVFAEIRKMTEPKRATAKR